MAITTIVFVQGEVPAVSKWNLIGSNDAALANGTAITAFSFSTASVSNPYKFSVYRNAALVSSSSAVVVQYDTKTFDTNSNVDVVTNKGRFTATVAGLYFFTAMAGNTTAGTTTIQSYLYKNGAVAKYGGFAGTGTTGGNYSTVSGLLQLAISDYVETFFIGGAGSVMGVGPEKCFFDGFLVSQT